jgi:hypothetical protein
MTNDDIVRLDQRVVNLEAVILNLAARLATVEQTVAGSIAKLDTLDKFVDRILPTTTTTRTPA